MPIQLYQVKYQKEISAIGGVKMKVYYDWMKASSIEEAQELAAKKYKVILEVKLA